MPCYFTRKIGHLELLSVWKLTETEEELLSLRSLSAEEIGSLSNLKTEKRRIEWLASRVLLQSLFEETIEIGYLPNGKPVLDNPDFFCSISHSKDFVSAIISKERAVGIDIEKMRNNIDALKNKFLTVEELKTIDTSDNSLLHLYWGAKEAMYKIYSLHKPLFTEHLSLKNVDLKAQKAIGIFSQGDVYKTVNIAFEQIEDNLLVYCSEN